MSINVTVTGNPISIKRGRIISAGLYPNGDFQKRRRIRLEQVRQQSKDIAENVRNRVKKATSKETSDIEKEGKLKLQEWQNKKLQGLQNQYRECIKDIGLGHTQGIIEEAEELAFIENRDRINNEKAIERGNIAAEKLKQQVAEPKRNFPAVVSPTDRLNNEKGIERVIIATEKLKQAASETKRKIPDVSPIKQRKIQQRNDGKIHDESKKCSTSVRQNENIKDTNSELIIQLDNDDLSIDEVVQDNEDDVSSSSTSNTSPRSSPTKQSLPKTPLDSEVSGKALGSLKEFDVFGSNFGSNEGTEVTWGVKKCDEKSAKIMDNRISERIKNRRLTTSIENMPTCSKEIVSDVKCKTCDRHNDEQYITRHSHSSHKCCCCKFCDVAPTEPSCSCRCKQLALENEVPQMLPTKRTVSLRTTDTLKSSKREYNKVHYYDHKNRFNKQILTDNSNMRKISDDSIEVCVNSDESDTVLEENKFRNDLEALNRGRQAVRKEMLQKQFKDLMEKLPILRKQDRIASLNPKKDKYHLSQSRLKEKEKRGQEKLEKACEQLIPNIITIEDKTGKGAHIWTDFNDDKGLSDRRIQDKEKDHMKKHSLIDENLLNDKDSLKKLLAKLKKQREVLMQEKETTDDISKLIDKLDVDNKLTRKKLKSKTPTKKKSSSNKTVLKSSSSVINNKTPSNSSSSTSSDSKVKKPSTPCSPLQKQRHKHKLRREVLILQNMSTQTSPNVPLKSDDSKSDTGTSISDKCSENEKVCEILIKIQENDKTDIIVKSPKKLFSNETKDSICWKQQLSKLSNRDVERDVSKNDTNYTSSTTYYSPPDITRQQNVVQMLSKPPQQLNLNYYKSRGKKEKMGKQNIDPRLLNLVRKLLQMSRGSIENLHVSGASEVSTPNSSVINIATNYIAEKVNKSSYNETTLYTSSSNGAQIINERNIAQVNESSLQSSNNLGQISEEKSININESNRINALRTQTQQTSFADEEIDYPEVAQQYSKIANHCQERIRNLSELIKLVRTEQKEMLSPTNSSGSDKNNSMTHYMNLPSVIEPELLTQEKNQQKELTSKLLQINLQDTNQQQTPKQITNDDIDPEIINRYLNILRSNSPERNSEVDSSTPLMLDIPKLPKLQQTSNENNHNHKRPPTGKIIKKFDMQPHELSTIQEADSIRNKSKSPESRKSSPTKQLSEMISRIQSDSVQNEFANLMDKLLLEQSKSNETPLKSPNQEKQSPLELNKNKSPPTKSKSPDKPSKSADGSKELDISQVIKRLQSVSTDTSSEKSELDVEAMLRNIGLDWAVSTARKTQEALAQHSSSSSSGGKLSSSPHVLPLKRNISTSTSKSDTNMSQYLRDFNNVSSICVNATCENQQRTSTPVNNESTKKSEQQALFTGESEMSPVQEKQDDDVRFVSLLNNSPDDSTDEDN